MTAPRVGELARRLGTSSQTTTRLVQRLEERGLVTSARGMAARRVVTVRLTARAVELWRDIEGGGGMAAALWRG